jgi:hypothetical protein
MSRCVSASLLLAAGFAAGVASAQDMPRQASGHAAALQTRPAHRDGTAGPRPGDRNCLRDTGSLIPARPGHCLPVAGRSYSQDDLRRTGQTDAAAALGQLDPGIAVHGR